MSLPQVPSNIKGAFFVHATITCKAGEADKFGAMLKTCAEVSNKEPGTLIYIAGKEADKENSFWVFEKYENPAAFEAHGRGDGLPPLAKSGLIESLYLHFTEEL